MSRQNLAGLDRDICQPLGRLIQEAFKHGIDCDIIHGGLLVGGSEQGLYEQSATPNYLVGTRRISPDGRVYRYARATNVIAATQFGLKFWAEIGDGIGYTAPKQTQEVGDTTIKVDSGKGEAGVAKDELVGGYVIIHTGDDQYQHFRGIVANTIADADGYVTITLDAPLKVAIKVTYGVEVYPNPYASVRVSSAGAPDCGAPDEYSSVAGMPNVKTTVANQYIWIQTWGPIWVNPHGTAGTAATADRRGLVFDREGSISSISETVGYGADSTLGLAQQYAGFIINRESVANGAGPPLVMLQISP